MNLSGNLKKLNSVGFRSFFWNAMYAGFNALQSAVILFVAARAFSGPAKGIEAGIITFGFTIANLMMVLGRYGIRNFQVTDTNEEYSFTDYFYCRIFSVPASAVAAIIYIAVMLILGKYTLYKSAVVLEIVVLKLVDAFEGLYVGRLQQKGRLDIGSAIAAGRVFLSTVAICVFMWFIPSTLWAFFCGIIVSIVFELIFIPRTKKWVDISVRRADGKKLKKLIAIGFSLCAGLTLYNYVGNAPKYLVDLFLTDELQAITGYVMMPMFVITILNTFIMQPVMKDLGDAWNGGNIKKFRKMAKRHILIISGCALAVLLAGLFIGLPLLSAMYKVDLGIYKTEFCILMAGGTLYTLCNYLIVLLTTVRKQKMIIAGCVASAAVYLALGWYAAGHYGFMGTCVLYIIGNVVMTAVFVAALLIKKKEK